MKLNEFDVQKLEWEMFLYIAQIVLLIVALVIIARLIFFLQKQHQQKRLVKKEPVLCVDLESSLEVGRQDDLSQPSFAEDDLLTNDGNDFDDIGEVRVVSRTIEIVDKTPVVEKEPIAFARKNHELKTTAPVEQATSSPKKVKETNLPREIISLTILAKKGQLYAGYDLLQVLLAAGFRYGDMSIFHRHENLDGTGEVLFSLAQAVQPGTFDLNDVGAFSCPGLIVFMEVNGHEDPLNVLNTMIDTVKLLVEDLGGDIYDDERKPLTAGSLARLRSRVLIQMRRKANI